MHNCRRRSGWRRYLVLIGAALWITQSASAQTQTGVWQPLGPRAVTAFAFERDPVDPAVLYIGTYFGGMYRSADRGNIWAPVESPFSASSVFAIARVPRANGRLYIGTMDLGIFTSDDGGTTWADRPGSNVGPIEDIAIDPNDDSIVFAATFGGILVSRNHGATWSLSTAAGEGITAVIFDPSTPRLAYAGTNGRGAYVTRDSGLTWAPFSTGLGQKVVTRFELDAASQGLVLAGTGEGVFRSRADGTGWENLTFDLATQPVSHVVSDPSSGALFAAADSGLYRLPSGAVQWERWTEESARFVLIDPTGLLVYVASTTGSVKVTGDNGETFWSSDFGIQNRFAEALTTVDAFGETVLYAGTDYHGIAYTSERFRNSRELPWIYAGSTGGGLFDVEAHPTVTGTIFMGTEGDGIFKSADFGQTWTPLSNGIVPAAVLSLDQSGLGAKTLYAGTSFGVFASQNNGQTWVPNTDTTPRPVSTVLADPARPTVAYYGTVDGEVFRTFDNGVNFDRSWEGTRIGIRKLAAARWGNIYAVNAAGELYSSDDLADNFFRRGTSISHQILTVAVDTEQPWIVYVGTLFGGVYKSATNAIQWAQTNEGMETPIVFSLAIDPSSASTIYAGSLDAVYKSSNAGETWSKVAGMLPPGAVTDIRVDRVNPHILYAAVADRGVFKSTDAGEHWAALREGSPFLGSVPIVLSTVSPSVVFAGTVGGGVHKSLDAGVTWSPSNDGLSLFVKDIVIDQNNPDIMYAASIADGVFKTIDGGENWTSIGLAGQVVYNITLDPASSNTLYAGTPTGVVRTTDGGLTWSELGQRMPYVFALASDPTERTKVYAGGLAGGFYRSLDSGRTWIKSAAGFPAKNVLAITVSPDTHQVFAAVEGEGVYSGGQAGGQWQRTSAENFGGFSVGSIATGSSNGPLYAGTLGNGIYKSFDAGKAWEKLPTNFPTNYVSAVRVHPTNANVVFAALLHSSNVGPAIYVSENGGSTWSTSAAGLASGKVYSLAIDGSNTTRMFAATAQGVYRSLNRGATWQLAGNGLTTASVRQVFVDAGSGGAVVYVGTEGQGVYRSADSGNTWTLVEASRQSANVSSFAAGPSGSLPYVGTVGNGVLYGISATTLGGGTEPSIAEAYIHTVALDPSTPTTMYATTGGQGVLKSENGGLTWHQANNGLDYPFLFVLIVDPVTPSTLYAATTGGGVFVSDNGGANWTAMNNGLFHKRVTCLALDVNDHRIIYAGTEGGGVFRLRR